MQLPRDLLHCNLSPFWQFNSLPIFLSHVSVSENGIEHKLCDFSYSEQFAVKFLILKINQCDDIMNVFKS